MNSRRRRREQDEVEVVEDSEPEREEQRQRGKDTRKRRKQMAQRQQTDQSFKDKVHEIAHVSKDTAEDTQLPVSTTSNNTNMMVIPDTILRSPSPILINVESNDLAAESAGKTIPSDHNLEIRQTEIHVVPPSPKSSIRRFHTPPPIEVLDDNTDNSSDEGGDNNRMKLDRFAFKASRSSILSSSQSKAAPLRTSPLATLNLNLKPLPATKNNQRNDCHVSADFSKVDIAKLLKCISCDIRWTARKTGNQKLVHIKSCAKKKALSHDTVRALMEREINNVSAGSSEPGKPLGQDLTPTTFLADVVNEVPAKKTKRPFVVKTVKALPETRGDILAKARAVLGSGISSTSQTEHESTQAFGRSRLGGKASGSAMISTEKSTSLAEFPSTQALSRSNLASRALGIAVNSIGTSTSKAELPSTQAFSRSKLGKASSSAIISTVVSTPFAEPSTQIFGTSKLGSRVTGLVVNSTQVFGESSLRHTLGNS